MTTSVGSSLAGEQQKAKGGEERQQQQQQQQQSISNNGANLDQSKSKSISNPNSTSSQSASLSSTQSSSMVADSEKSATSSKRTSTTSSNAIVYHVEHLATFSTATNTGPCHEQQTTFANKSLGANSDTNATADEANHHHRQQQQQQQQQRELGQGNGKSHCKNKSATTGHDGDSSIIDKSFDASTTTPKAALERLFELEKLSGIWTQRMQIELRDDLMLILDCETNSIVEKFHRNCVLKPEAFDEFNDIYNNILVFIIKQQQQQQQVDNCASESDSKLEVREDSSAEAREATDCTKDQEPGEIHIFQCVSHKAQQLMEDILSWKKLVKMDDIRKEKETVLNNTNNTQEQTEARFKSSEAIVKGERRPTKVNADDKPKVTVGTASNSVSGCDKKPIVKVNVKETVQVFNQIAALREKSGKPTSPTNNTAAGQQQLDGADAVGKQQQQTRSNSGEAGAKLPLPGGGGNNSSGGQLYKQRSIRAKLAAPSSQSPAAAPATDKGAKPVLTTGPAADSARASGNNLGSNNTSSAAASTSSASSLASSSAAAGPQSNGNSKQGVGQNAGTNHRDQEHAKADPKQQQQPQNNQSSSRRHQVAQQAAASGSQQSKGTSKSHRQQRSQTDSSRSFQAQSDQVTKNESYVSVLNHCFDDIERFIIRLQQAAAAVRELQMRQVDEGRKGRLSYRSSNNHLQLQDAGKHHLGPMTSAELSLLQAKARGPSEDDYFEILSKFKLAFNLLAKLKGCIHEPNAPELVHFLFTPLAIVIESARNVVPPVDPTIVGIPYLNQDALDLLSNCCSSKESDMWLSLGPNWTHTIDMNLLMASRLPSSFQPIFSDGWAPIIGELELIGLVAPPSHLSAAAVAANQAQSASSASSSSASSSTANVTINSKTRHPGNVPMDELGSRASGSRSHQHAPDQYLMSQAGLRPVGKKRNSTASTALAMDNSVPMQQQHYPNQQASATTLSGGNPYLNPNSYLYDDNSSELPPVNMAPPAASGYRAPEELLGAGRRTSASNADLHYSRRGGKNLNAKQQHFNPSVSSHQYSSAAGDESHLSHIDLQADSSRAHASRSAQHGKLSRGHQKQQVYDEDYSELDYLEQTNTMQIINGDSFRLADDELRHQRAPQARGYRTARTAILPDNYEPTERQLNYFDQAEHEALIQDLGPAQTEWFYELQARGAPIVRVLFTREANNDKELSVTRGELLEVLDDTRKWWRTRNIELQVAHVPHTIVAPMLGYQTLDELLTNNPSDLIQADDEPNLMLMNQAQFRYAKPDQQWASRPEKRRVSNNPKSVGAFRYF